MSPDQKQQLIESLQEELSLIVGMCGDGANDCGALKAADAGISLSNTEASVASSFTYTRQNISCVPILICEGRTALVSSFGTIKVICLCSLTQFTSIILLYTIDSRLTDPQFLYIDIMLLVLVFLFCKTEASSKLDPKPPPNKLLAWRPVISLIVQYLLILLVQILLFIFTQKQPWFEAYEGLLEEDEDNSIVQSMLNNITFNMTSNDDDGDEEYAEPFEPYETNAIFVLSLFQYVTQLIIFSKGKPYRKSILTNKLFALMLLLATLFSMFLCLNSIQFVYSFFLMRMIPHLKFRFIIIGFAVIHFIVAFIFEKFIVDYNFSLVEYLKQIRIGDFNMNLNCSSIKKGSTTINKNSNSKSILIRT
jgi:cation-transporting P-type ATPase 13A2